MRLHNEPCAACGQDTLHKGSVCTICGGVAWRPMDRILTRNAALRQKYGAIQNKFGAGFDRVKAQAMEAKRLGLDVASQRRDEEAAKRIAPETWSGPGNSTFGKGRERTKT